jgi:tetratricopeptide (TPR) repeat protein
VSSLAIYKGLRRLVGLLPVLFIGACASVPQDSSSELVSAEPQTTVQETPEKEQKSPERPNIELTEDILFKVMLAEIAGQRGKLKIAVENYLDLARTTRDPVVVERATRIAMYARNNDAAYEAAALWLELDPESPDAHQVMTVMTVRRGDIDQALHHLEFILENSHGKFDQKLWMIANFLGREKDQLAVMQLMERLMENHMGDADAMFAFANVSARMGDMDRAQDLLEQVVKLEPENDAAVLTYIAILQKREKTKEALEWLKLELEDRKDDFNLRMAYARLLTDAKRFEDAREQFETLVVDAPNNVDVLYALGLLYLQVNKLDDAERFFTKLTTLKKRIFDSNYYLGRIAEERDEFDKASDLYQGVHGGENYFDARIRLSLIQAKQGDIEKALTNIRSIKGKKGINRLILVQAEGEILTEEKRYQEAMNVYNKAIEEESHPDLLYSRAMLAEKMGLMEILETDLKAILAEDAENATALNALGYTLADRTERFDEAYDYIKRAYAISPDDFYILDSLGWVLYRLGRFDEAADFLQKALELKNDPEIAAHLGEVYWVMGNKKAAREIWETALKGTPTDDRLLEVIKRFKP